MNALTIKRFALAGALVGWAVLATTGQVGRPHSPLTASASTGDSLYVGDAGDNSVKRFDAQTGAPLGAFVPSGSGGLDGPRGMLYEGHLLVSNQNIDQSYPGEIDQYSHVDGKSLGALVPHTAPNAPFDPDGIIRGPDNRTLYVADIGDLCATCGRVAAFDVDTGHFLGNLDFSSFITSSTNPTPGEFHPRGLVFGPNGLLYITLRSLVNDNAHKALGGIVSYNLRTGTAAVVASYSPSATDCSGELHRPDGLTFSPDGTKLYVTSFASPLDPVAPIDRILIFNGGTGACVGEIGLDQAGQPRTYAQYLLFGPGGYLFVPIVTSGAVRRYDVSGRRFPDFVAPGGPLVAGWGLTFGLTNPSTLAYGS